MPEVKTKLKDSFICTVSLVPHPRQYMVKICSRQEVYWRKYRTMVAIGPHFIQCTSCLLYVSVEYCPWCDSLTPKADVFQTNYHSSYPRHISYFPILVYCQTSVDHGSNTHGKQTCWKKNTKFTHPKGVDIWPVLC